MNDVHVTNGLFALPITNGTGTFQLSREVPLQTVILETVKISVNTLTSDHFIRVELPFISPNCVLNAVNHSRVCIPLGDNDKVTIYNPKWSLDLNARINQPFTVQVYDSQGNPITSDLPNLVLIFSFSFLD